MKTATTVANVFDIKVARAIIAEIVPGKRAKATDDLAWLSVATPVKDAIKLVRAAGWRADYTAPEDKHVFLAKRAHPGLQIEVDFDGEKVGNILILVSAVKPPRKPRSATVTSEVKSVAVRAKPINGEIKKVGSTGIKRVPPAAAEVPLTRSQKRTAARRAAKAAAAAAEAAALAKPASRIRRTRPADTVSAVVAPVSERVKGAKIEFKDGGDWERGLLASDRIKDEDGKFGFNVKAQGEVFFVYSKNVRLRAAA
jgi:hypothetical protein